MNPPAMDQMEDNHRSLLSTALSDGISSQVKTLVPDILRSFCDADISLARAPVSLVHK